MQNKLRTIMALSGKLHEIIDEYSSAPDFSVKTGDLTVSVKYDFNDELSHIKAECNKMWVIVDSNATPVMSLSDLSLGYDLEVELDTFIDNLVHLSQKVDLRRNLIMRSISMNHHKSEFNKLSTIEL